MTQYTKNDPLTIQQMFNGIAKNYDRTNGILSFQMHRRWNRTLIEEVLVKHTPKTILDLCCGTGAIAFEYLKKVKSKPSVTMLDFSSEMLAYAKKKAEQTHLDHHNITYLEADAESLPLPDQHFDCATIAYGIRNIKQPKLCLSEVYRVLKTDGTFGILELTQPKNPLLRLGHTLYLRTALPVMGKLMTSNKEAYRYLCNSIHSFIPPDHLEAMMQSAGFKNVQQIPLMGGIATIFIGEK